MIQRQYLHGNPEEALPRYDGETNTCLEPAVVILGAGASIASCLDKPEKNGHELPSMSNLVEVVGLEEEIKSAGVDYDGGDFEAFYSTLTDQNTHPELVKKLEERIVAYFKKLELPDEATIYDRLILSLRSKDMIASFNWDPFLLQAYLRNGRRLGKDNLPQIHFLHGNVRIGPCLPCKTVGIMGNNCSKCNKPFEPSQLLFPVKEKNYDSDGLIKNEWDALRQKLRRVYLMTFFGYSAPKTDVVAKKFITEDLDKNIIRRQQEIEIIDIEAKENQNDLTENWEGFPFQGHYGWHPYINESFIFRFPRRGCEALYAEKLLDSFLDDAAFKDFVEISDLAKLQDWVGNLIQEEKNRCLAPMSELD